MKIRLPKFILLISCLALTVSSASAQKKMLKKLFGGEKDTTRSSSFLPLPVVGYSQETGFEFGLVTLYSFYTDRADTLTRNSTITGVATFTTKKQSNFQFKTNIWQPQNRYHYETEIRYKNFPFNYYGIGSETLEANESKITQKLFRLNAEAEKLFGKISYTGLTASFENYKFKYDDTFVPLDNSQFYTEGQSSGKIFFAGISQSIDSRNTNTYTSKGTYIKVNYSYAPDFFGGDNFSGSLLKTDFRTFKSLASKLVLGVNGNYQSLNGSKAPFYLLPQLGNDNIMRGYYTGRYRDNNLLALQAEIRYRFNPRFGLVGFAGAGTVYKSRNFNFSDLKPSLGGGFRYFFDVERGLSVRMDYAIGEKRAGESRQSGFYLALGESF